MNQPPACLDPGAIAQDLRKHLRLGEELLAIVSRENEALRAVGEFPTYEFHQQRKNLLARLDRSLNALRTHRARWLRWAPEERAGCPEISALLRSNQEMIMKIVVRDRENEQALLRRGLVPPRHLPPVQRQQPHYVADLYRRHQS
jgi:hypothetical protein